MKKLVIILLLFLVTTSCNKYIVSNIYEKTYATEELAVPDVYKQLHVHGLDSIPLNQWITNFMNGDSMQIEQKIVRKILDKKTNYTFTYTKYIYPVKSSSYQFVIRYQGKK